MAEPDEHQPGHRPADPGEAAEPVARRVAELSAALEDARAAEARARAALAAAQELNATLLAQREQGAGQEELEALRARAALADEMAATRTWRWSRLPRRVWGRIRRTVRRGAGATGTRGGG